MNEVRHQVTQDQINKNIVVISALTLPGPRVLVETSTLPFHEAAELDQRSLKERVEVIARANEERLKQRLSEAA